MSGYFGSRTIRQPAKPYVDSIEREIVTSHREGRAISLSTAREIAAGWSRGRSEDRECLTVLATKGSVWEYITIEIEECLLELARTCGGVKRRMAVARELVALRDYCEMVLEKREEEEVEDGLVLALHRDDRILDAGVRRRVGLRRIG